MQENKFYYTGHKYLKSSRSFNKKLKLFTGTQHFSLRLQSAMQLSDCKNLVLGGVREHTNVQESRAKIYISTSQNSENADLLAKIFNDHFEIIILDSAFPSKRPVTSHCKKCISPII